MFGEIDTVDHLITCAAEIVSGPFAELPESDARDLFETKFWGQHRCVKAALPRLARDGSIVLLSGFLYRKTEVGFSPCAAVNGAIEGLFKALSLDLAPIRFNALSPGQIDVFGGRMDEAAHRQYREAVAA